MIKCEAKVCATVSRAAEKRTTKEGKSYMSMAVYLTITSKKGEAIKQEILVSTESKSAAGFKAGQKIEAEGQMSIRQRGDKKQMSLWAQSVKATKDDDLLEATVEATGAVGAKIDEKKDRKGNPMLCYSMYSSEKNGEQWEYTWIRVVGFGFSREDWLQPKARVCAKGRLEVEPYQGKASLACVLLEHKLQEPRPPYQPREPQAPAAQGADEAVPL